MIVVDQNLFEIPATDIGYKTGLKTILERQVVFTRGRD